MADYKVLKKIARLAVFEIGISVVVDTIHSTTKTNRIIVNTHETELITMFINMHHIIQLYIFRLFDRGTIQLPCTKLKWNKISLSHWPIQLKAKSKRRHARRLIQLPPVAIQTTQVPERSTWASTLASNDRATSVVTRNCRQFQVQVLTSNQPSRA